jgi:hypothetical protein
MHKNMNNTNCKSIITEKRSSCLYLGLYATVVTPQVSNPNRRSPSSTSQPIRPRPPAPALATRVPCASAAHATGLVGLGPTPMVPCAPPLHLCASRPSPSCCGERKIRKMMQGWVDRDKKKEDILFRNLALADAGRRGTSVPVGHAKRY